MSKLKRLLAGSLGIAVAFTAPAAMAQWAEQGPGPTLNGQVEGLRGNPVAGGINAIAVDLRHPGTVYAATTNGGVWKSTNATSPSATWTPLTDLKLPALSINSIAISPLDAATIFAGTGSTSSDGFDGSPGFGVIRSTDGGNSWAILAGATFAGRRINSIVPLARSSGGVAGQVVLAATLFDGGGAWRSVNGGAAFTRVSGSAGLPDGGVSSLVADPSNSTRLYAAVPANYGAGAAAGVYRSDDAGLSWHAVNTGLSGLGSSLRVLLAVGRHTGVVYAMVIDNAGGATGVFRSANGGATWSALGVPTPTIYPGLQGFFHGAIAADPVNPDVVYVSGDRQGLPNPNGCNNFSANTFRGDAALASPWQNVVCDGAHGTSPHADSRAMDFDSSGNLLQANDGGIYRLTNPQLASRVWDSLNGNIRPTEMHSAAFDAVARIAFGGTQDTGTTMQYSPGSRFWNDFLTGDGGVVGIDDTSAGGASSIRYTSFQFLGFFNRSTWSASNALVSGPTALGLQITSGPGAGQNLYAADPNIQFYNPYEINRVDPSRMLIGTASIYESGDRGDTLANLGYTGKFISSLSYGGRLAGVPKPDAFYAGTYGPARPLILHRGGAGGAVGELAAYPGSGVRDLVMDPLNIKRIYVVDELSRVWASLDEGLTWRELTAGLARLLGDARTIELIPSACHCTTELLVGGLGGVFHMRNPDAAGAAWTRLGSNLPNGLVRDLRYNPKARVLVAAILGRGAWTVSYSAAATFDSSWVSAGTTAATDAAAAATPLLLPAGVPMVAPRARTSDSKPAATPGK